ncbi:MAG: PhoH family protein, partial [Candidatus Omnitrophica bacterium]|nr:PhoH family protein [Candidatus Omnitrophota bacterium]
MPIAKKKIFVLDTNVILHDSTCYRQFHEHDVVIPITVLEELDQFKKGNESLNYHAREFARSIDTLSGDKIFNGGVSIDADKGKLSVKLDREFHDDIRLSFSPSKPDHHILNLAYCLSKDNPKKEVILVSKDVNLRMKAKSIGILAQDYKTDQVKDVSSLYTGHRVQEGISEALLERLHSSPYEVEISEFPAFENPLTPNECLILRNGKASALGAYDAGHEAIRRIDRISAYGIQPRNAEQTFALEALLNDDISLVTISGKAGTGKTLLALAAALQNRRSYRQIFMARPVVPLSNKDLGFLPGDIQSKLDPYMQPLFDNLGVIKMSDGKGRAQEIGRLLEEEKLVISPLAYIRGRSLVKVFFIVDEAQNLTPHEVKTIITRAGEGT